MRLLQLRSWVKQRLKLALIRPEPSVRLAGVILGSGEPSPAVESARTELIRETLNKVNVERVIACGPAIAIKPALPALADLHQVRKKFPAARLVVIPTDQYHVAPAHLEKLLAAVERAGDAAAFDTRDTYFLSNMGLHFSAAVLGPAWDMPQGQLFGVPRFGAPDPTPNSVPMARLELTDNDIQAGFGAYARTTVPTTITIELNSTCNFTCGYCPFHGADLDNPLRVLHGEEMSLEDFERLVKEVASWEDRYSGQKKTIFPYRRGEFFLSKKWREALRIIQAHGLRSCVVSNGSAITEKNAEHIFEDRSLNSLIISLEATTHEIFSKTRSDRFFDKIVNVIKYILAKRRETGHAMTFALNFTLIKENQAIVEEYVRSWAPEVDYILMGPAHQVSRDSQHGEFIKLPPMFNTAGLKTRKVPCVYLLNSIGIDCDLNLGLCTPCGSMRKTIANLKNLGIREAQGQANLYQKVLQMHLDGSYRKYDYCAKCHMSEFHFAVEDQLGGHKAMVGKNAWTIYPEKKSA